MATKKAKKEVATTIDFTNSIEKIKGTAKTVNTEVVDTTIEVLEDLRTNGEKIRTVATTKVKEAIENLTIDNSVKFVKNTAKNIHTYNIETAEEVIDLAVKGGKEWQAFLAKSLKNGVQFFGQQQDITLTALEGLKKQYEAGNFRFSNLFNFDFNIDLSKRDVAIDTPALKTVKKTVKKAATKAKSTAKKATKATAKVAKTATKKAAKVTKPFVKKATVTAKATTKKVTAKVTKPVAKKVTTKKVVKPVAKKAVAKKVTTKKVVKPVAKKVTAKKVVKPVAKKTVNVTKNNLRLIEGIGPKIEELLNKGGIQTFQQLATASQGTLKGILAAGGARYKMHDPTTWNQQATLAAAGKKAELSKLQAELKGGRAKK